MVTYERSIGGASMSGENDKEKAAARKAQLSALLCRKKTNPALVWWAVDPTLALTSVPAPTAACRSSGLALLALRPAAPSSRGRSEEGPAGSGVPSGAMSIDGEGGGSNHARGVSPGSPPPSLRIGGTTSVETCCRAKVFCFEGPSSKTHRNRGARDGESCESGAGWIPTSHTTPERGPEKHRELEPRPEKPPDPRSGSPKRLAALAPEPKECRRNSAALRLTPKSPPPPPSEAPRTAREDHQASTAKQRRHRSRRSAEA